MKRHFLGVLIFFLTLALIFQACKEKTDEELILDMMDEVGRLAEEKDIESLLRHLAEDYSDFRNRGKKETREMLQSYFSQFRGIVIHMLSTRIVERSSSEAIIQTEMALSSGGARILRRLIKISTDNYRLKLSLIKRNDEWLIQYAEWKTVSLSELFPESLSILQKITKRD